MSLNGAPKELKKQKTGTAKLNRLAAWVVNSFVNVDLESLASLF